MNIKTLLLSSLIFLSVSSASAEITYITKLVNAELEAFDKSRKTVVVSGKQYKYKLEVNKSSYTYQDDIKKSVNFSDLKVGESYYFQMMATGNKAMINNDYQHVTFIATSKPAE